MGNCTSGKKNFSPSADAEESLLGTLDMNPQEWKDVARKVMETALKKTPPLPIPPPKPPRGKKVKQNRLLCKKNTLLWKIAKEATKKKLRPVEKTPAPAPPPKRLPPPRAKLPPSSVVKRFNPGPKLLVPECNV